VPDPTVQRLAPKLIRALDRAVGFCQATLAFGKAQEPAPQPRKFDLNRMRRPARPARPGRGWAGDLTVEMARPMLATADPDQLAARADEPLPQQHRGDEGQRPTGGPGGTLTHGRAAASGEMIEIEIADTGPGVPAEIARTCSRPFSASGGRRHRAGAGDRRRTDERPGRQHHAGRGRRAPASASDPAGLRLCQPCPKNYKSGG
jgi:hypothetical protein